MNKPICNGQELFAMGLNYHECTEWKRIDDTEQKLLYEGDTYNERPCGVGKVYYPDGTVFQDGFFGVKGILVGREYYNNGNLRFEGVYGLNRGYGPNPPRFGRFCDYDGNEVFCGIFSRTAGGVGYPTIIEPKGFGSIRQPGHPNIHYLMWEDVEMDYINETMKRVDSLKMPETALQLTRMIDMFIDNEESCRLVDQNG